MKLPTKAEVLALRDGGPRKWAADYALTLKQTATGAEPCPFTLDDYMVPLWDAYESRTRAAVRKSRQMRLSWFGAVSRLYSLMFRRDWASFMLSRKEKLVDDGGNYSTPQSLFGKVRFIYDHLPEWQRRGNPLEFSHLKIHNPRTGSTITGESTAQRSGAGGSYQDAWWDEAAHGMHGEQVLAAVDQACPMGLWLVSTPKGKGNVFARVYLGDTGYQKIDIPWWKHPERACQCTSPLDLDVSKHSGCWYARACEGMTPAQIASELNMSFDESVSGRVWYGWSDRCVGDVEYDPSLPPYRAWDFGVGDQTAIIFGQTAPLHSATGRLYKQLRIFDAYRNSGQGALHYREVCAAKANGGNLTDIGDPHNLSSRDSDLGSWQRNLADDRHAYKIHVRPSACRGVPYETVLDNARKFMGLIECQDGKHRPRLVVDRKLTALIDCFENWRYRTDDEGRIVGDKPIHDDMSHWMDAYKYLCWHLDPAGMVEFDPAKAPITTGAEEYFKEAAQW